MDYPDKMVIAAGPGARSRFQEVIDQDIVDGLPTGNLTLGQKSVKKPKRHRFGPVLTIQRLLVLNKISERFR
jgi:hypothetical protein